MNSPYPPVGFHFKVEFSSFRDDIDLKFQEVSGLSAEMTFEELVEGGVNKFTHKLPTRTKYGNLILKRGFVNNSKLVDWMRAALEDFKFQTSDITVSLLNENSTVLSSWQVIGAYPVKWVISDFKAMENSIAVETLEFAYQYFKK